MALPYAHRRCAWGVLDHAWEQQDKTNGLKRVP